MAVSNKNVVDIISRKGGKVTAQVKALTGGVTLNEASIVRIHGSADQVQSYERQGNDLIITMKDGSQIRCHNFFLAENGEHSELVFDDGQHTPQHVIFPAGAAEAYVNSTPMVVKYENMSDITPLLIGSHKSNKDILLGLLGLGAIGGVSLGTHNNGVKKHHKTGPATENEFIIINPFAGDNILNAQEVTVEQFLTGSVVPSSLSVGQTITLSFDGNIYTTVVGEDGTWSFALPPSVLQGLSDGSYVATVTVTDITGNTIEDSIIITVDTTAPELTLNPVEGDNIINAQEAQGDVLISGTASLSEAGLLVTVTVEGPLFGSFLIFTAVVGEDGTWSVLVPAAVVQSLANGNYLVTATLTDQAGNTASVSEDVLVAIESPASELPTIHINTFAGDDILSAAEAALPQAISGVTSGIEAGQVVTIILNNKTYSAVVQADGSWSTVVSPQDLQALPDGTATIVAQVSDLAGNVASNSQTIDVEIHNTLYPTINIDPFAGDDNLSLAKSLVAQILSGVSSDVEAGSVVIINIGNLVFSTSLNYTAVVQAGGYWSVSVPPADMAKLSDGYAVINVSVTNSEGQVATDAQTFVVDTHNGALESIAISPFTGDNVLNSQESHVAQVISGITTNIPAGQIVTITLGGKSYTATVQADGSWSTTVPAADLVQLAQGKDVIDASVHDAAGNLVSTSLSIIVDTSAPTLTINPIEGNDIINEQEAQQGVVITGTASLTEVNGIVTVTVNGKNYTGFVKADGSWSITLSAADALALPQGAQSLTATLTDFAGNTTVASRPFNVDTDIPTLTISPFTGDNILDGAESQTTQFVTGTTNAEPGQIVTVTLNGKTYQATVQANGSWSAAITSADLLALPAGQNTITATVTDHAGNVSAPVTDTFTYQPSTGGIAINPVDSDNYINAVEAAAGILISGTTLNVAAGAIVTVTLNNKTYQAVVQANDSWSVAVNSADLSVLSQGNHTITASVLDVNNILKTATDIVIVDTIPPLLVINPIDGGVLNAQETTQPLVITGSTTPDEAGRTVTLIFHGKSYTAIVQADGTWSTTVPTADLQGLPQGNMTVTATITDPAGNQGTANQTLLVDTVSATLTLNPFAGDNILNYAESLVNQPISGTTSGVLAGQVVTITLNGKTYSATVQANGSWSTTVPSADLVLLQDGSTTISATVTDRPGGNPTSASEILQVFSDPGLLPTIQINPFAGDNKLTPPELLSSQTVSGITSHVQPGQVVTITFNGKSYTATVQGDGTWSTVIPVLDLGALLNGVSLLTASVTDIAGNPAFDSQDIDVSLLNPIFPIAVIYINPFAGDDFLSQAESLVPQTLSGTTTDVNAGETVTITLNGKTYTATVQADGTWSTVISVADMALLPDGHQTITATVTNHNILGNSTATDSLTITVDIHGTGQQPAITLNPFTGDNILNQQESQSPQTVSGNTVLVPVGNTVTILLNGKTYTATVQADGSWSTQIPAADLQQLSNGQQYNITASATDYNGNTVSISEGISVGTVPPTLTINPVEGNGYINAADEQSPLVISGTASAIDAGRNVQVILNGKTYTATVQANGTWSTTVPTTDLQSLPQGAGTVTAVLTDISGNTATATQSYTVDTIAPTLSINPFTGDNVLNGAESQTTQNITGTTNAEPGQVVTVTLNGKTYTAIVQAGGSWSTSVSSTDLQALSAGSHIITATVSDKAGNPSTQATDTFTYNPTTGGISINPVDGNNYINAAEVASGITISGTTSNVAQGQTVTVTLNGNTYTATVQANGSWSVAVSSVDLSVLNQGPYTITASVTDQNSQQQSANDTVTVDTIPPTLTINPIEPNGILNSQDISQPLPITGSTTPDEVGRTVTVTFNGKTYTAIVQADGSWSTTVPTADLQGLPQGDMTVTATLTDPAGNSATASQILDVDTVSPVLTLAPFAGDNILNYAESLVNQPISGTTSGVQAGQVVTITLNGKTYTATVLANGTWSTTIPSADLVLLLDGSTTISATVTDKPGGNSANASETLQVFSQPGLLPTIQINPFAGDNKLTPVELLSSQTVSGITSHVQLGQIVTITFNGHTYTATVQADGTWSTVIPVLDLGALLNGVSLLTASVTDIAGNPAFDSQDIDVSLLNPIFPIAVIYINPFAGDDFLSQAESLVPQTLSGTTTDVNAGEIVTITLNGKTYTATVQADGTWSTVISVADMALLPDGHQTITATVTNHNILGNSTATDSLTITVDIHGISQAPAITLNPFTGDNILNQQESQAAQTISGNTVLVPTGNTVTILLNGKTYTATVQADGSWSAQIPAADLQQLINGQQYTITVSATAYNGSTVSTTESINVDTVPPTLTINPIEGNGYINAADEQSPLVISGTASLADAGQNVQVTLNGKTYTATIQANGTWSTTVPTTDLQSLPQGAGTVTAVLTDIASNTTTATQSYTVDTIAPTLSINPFTGDNVLDNAESQTTQNITGTTNAEPGQVVTITLNGKTYTAVVLAGGSWSTSVSSTDLQALSAGSYTITATVSDKAGNPSLQATDTFTYNPAAGGIAISPVDGTNYINAAEAAAGISISGTTSNVAQGQTVTVTLNGNTYTTTVQADGSWSVAVSSADLSVLTQGPYTVNASVTDQNSQLLSTSDTVTVDTIAPTLAINLIEPGGVLNIQEASQPLPITGLTNPSEAGRIVTVTFNGKTYTATVQADGSWSTTVPATDLQGLPQGNMTVTAALTDAAGNPATANQILDVDTVSPVLTLTPFAGDNILNYAESLVNQPISGTTSGVQAGQAVTITLNGKTYSATVQANGSWSTTIPSADLVLLLDGSTTISATVTDRPNGNSVSASEILQVFSQPGLLPTIQINPFAGDNKLTVLEQLSAQTVSGITSHVQPGQVVSITFNGQTYTATVQGDGTWSTVIPVLDLGALLNGISVMTASVTDIAGNPASDSQDIDVFLLNILLPAAVIYINPFAGDDFLSQAESLVPQTLSGTTTDVNAGEIVTITLNGKTYTATVQADGTWSTVISVADMALLSDGHQTITATVTNHNILGNSTATDSLTITVDIHGTGQQPAIILNPFTGDNVLNQQESQAAQTVSGNTVLVPGGNVVTILLNGKSYQATVQADGSWSAQIPAADLQQLTNGQQYTITAFTLDNTGHTVSTTESISVDTVPPTLTVNLIEGNGYINAADEQSPLVINGTASLADAGQNVQVSLNGKTYNATIQANGTWSATVPATDLQSLPQGAGSLTAFLTDAAGNTTTATQSYTVDTIAPTLSINPFTGDNILDNAESQTTQNITGTTSAEPGQVVTVTLNGKTYTAVVQAGGSWSTSVSSTDLQALSAGSHIITATVSDKAGNPSLQATDTFTYNPTAGGIAISPVDGTNYINAAEVTAGITISGTTSNVAQGQTVTVTLNGKTYTVAVQADGSWSVAVSSADLSVLNQGPYTITASVTDQNSQLLSTSDTVTVDTITPTLSINTIEPGGVLNIQEASQPLPISGSASISEAGRTVIVTLNGKTYTATVQANGSWSTTVPSADLQALPQGNMTVTATLTDAAGNQGSTNQTLLVDTISPTLTLSPLAGDNILSYTESQSSQTLTGTTTGVQNGQVVTITLNGKTYQGTVQANGSWSAVISSADLQALADGSTTISATVMDRPNGNSVTSTETLQVYAQPGLLPTIQLNPFAGDNKLTVLEQLSPQTVSGITSNVQAGQIVAVTLNGNHYSATVQADGTWSTVIPVLDLQALLTGVSQLTASVTDIAGNLASTSQNLSVDLVNLLLPNAILWFKPFATDDNLSLVESQTAQTISGGTSGVNSGEIVTITLNGKTYTATVQGDGTWSTTVSTTDLANLPAGHQIISASVTSHGGLLGNSSDSETLTITVNKQPAVFSAFAASADLLFADTEAVPLVDETALADVTTSLSAAAQSEVWDPALLPQANRVDNLPAEGNGSPVDILHPEQLNYFN